MYNISAVTETIKKIPQLLSSVSQGTWKTITAVAVGVIVSVGSAITLYKMCTRRKDQEGPVISKTPSTISAWDELGIKQQYCQPVRECIKELRTSLDSLKREGAVQITDPKDAFPLVDLLNKLEQAIGAAIRAIPGDNENNLKAQTINKLGQSTGNLKSDINRIQPHQNAVLRQNFIEAFPEKVATLEKLLTDFEKEFK